MEEMQSPIVGPTTFDAPDGAVALTPPPPRSQSQSPNKTITSSTSPPTALDRASCSTSISIVTASSTVGDIQRSRDEKASRCIQRPRKRSVAGENADSCLLAAQKRIRLQDSTTPPEQGQRREFNKEHSDFGGTVHVSPTSPKPLPSPSQSPMVKRYSDEPRALIRRDTSAASRWPRWDLPDALSAFDHLTDDAKTQVLLELLKRTSMYTLQIFESIVSPTLKRDFMSLLPQELTPMVISYLDAQSLCRASCVNRHWQSVIDSSAKTWRSLLETEDFQYDGHQNWNKSPQKNSHSSLKQNGENTPVPYLAHAGHPFKETYRRQSTLRQNWRKGRAKRIRFQGHPDKVVTCLQFDDKYIVSGTDDALINIHDTSTGELKRHLRGHEGGVWALEYIGYTLVSGSTDRTVRVWDMERGVCTHVFSGHNLIIRCLQIVMPTLIDGRMQPSTPLIVTGSRDTTLRVWRLPDPRNDAPYDGTGPNPYHLHTLNGHSHSVRALAAHGNMLVSGSYDHEVRLWNLETGRMVHRLQGHTQKVYSVVIDPVRHRCMSGSMDGTVRVWDIATGVCLQVLEGHTILVGLLGLTPNNLVSAAADTTLRVWSPDTGECRHILAGHHGAITCFQHNDEVVISGSEDGLKMWDIKTGRHIRNLITDVSCVWRVAFDHRRCVVAVRNGTVTSFEVLDFGVHGLEDGESSTPS